MATARLRWVDLAKGVTMLLIVLTHVLHKHYVRLGWDVDTPIRGAWLELSAMFAPLRMPLFLLLSGFLAARSLQRAWRPVVLRRVVTPYLLYVLWFTINAVFLLGLGFAEADGLEPTVGGVLRSLVLPHTTLWYMVALAVFSLGAVLLRRFGAAVPLAGAFALSAVVYAGWLVLPAWTGMVESMLRYFPLFLLGALLPELPRRISGWRGGWVLVAAAPLYLAVAAIYRLGGASLPGFGPLAAVVGATVGILVAVRLTGVPRLGAGLEHIGRRTLPIFVLHIPVLAVVHALATGPAEALWAPLLGDLVAATAYPAVLSGLVVALCLAVHTGLERAGAGWLFALPIGTVSRRSAGSRSPATAP